VDSGLGKDRAGVFLFELLYLTRERWSMQRMLTVSGSVRFRECDSVIRRPWSRVRVWLIAYKGTRVLRERLNFQPSGEYHFQNRHPWLILDFGQGTPFLLSKFVNEPSFFDFSYSCVLFKISKDRDHVKRNDQKTSIFSQSLVCDGTAFLLRSLNLFGDICPMPSRAI
jgi:hypothetical protein